jgi:hypothetical protein
MDFWEIARRREEKALKKLKVKRKAALQGESQETGTNELARA